MRDGRCLRWVVALLAAVAAAGVLRAGEDLRAGDELTAVGGSRWTTGNSVRLLSSPQEAWEARLEIVSGARHNIHITSFSWHDDRYGRLFRERLIEVIHRRRLDNPDFQVRIVVDSTARGLFDASFRKLEEAGAVIRSFNPRTWGIAPVYDLRMHDKMIVVDGRQAIVGGRNLSDTYFDPTRWWLDFGIVVEGEAVRDLQVHFLETWETVDYLRKPHRVVVPVEVLQRRVRNFLLTGRFPNGRSPLDPYLNDICFPPIEESAGDVEVAILYDNPLIRSSAASVELLARLVSAARREVDLMTPFPNFTTELTTVLKAAVKRGVRVRLFVNGADAALRRGPFLWAGLPTVIELAEAGAEVWAWEGNGHVEALIGAAGCSPVTRPPVALHGKLARIDDQLTIVHSSNFNIRSTYYNTEAGAVIRNAAFNRVVKERLDGLISLRDLRLECGEGLTDVTIERIVGRVGPQEIEEFRRVLGGKQKFLDSMGLLW